MAYALNIIKLSGTIAKSYICKNLKKELVKSDIIINCSNKKNILETPIWFSKWCLYNWYR